MNTGHIGINVTDLERSKQFYIDLFGFEIMGGSESGPSRYLFLGDGKNIHLTLWEQSQGRFEKARPGLHHLSFRASSPAEVKQIEQKLLARKATIYYEGIVPHSAQAESGGIFFEDPDGTRLEVFTENVSEVRSGNTPAAPACGFF